MNVPLANADAVDMPFQARSDGVGDRTGHDDAAPAAAGDDSPRFSTAQLPEICSFYRENGYAVVRNLIGAELCATANCRFDEQIRPSRAHLYRHAIAKPERHVFSAHGFMLNPLRDIQSLDVGRFGGFREAGLAILTHPDIQGVVGALLGESLTLVRSMCFEGNPAGGVHQDTYFLDGEVLGSMVGACVALEDIAPGAGRLAVYPKSHLIALQRSGGEIDVVRDRGRYRELVVDLICLRRLERRVPALRCGDVLFWSSKTMHGSLGTTEPQFSRRSLTAHYIPGSSRLLEFHSRIRRLNPETVNGMQIHKPRDLDRRSQRVFLRLESLVPRRRRSSGE